VVHPEQVVENLAGLRQRIAAAGGDPARVGILAVTKTFGVDAARAAVAAGLSDLGENYAAELLAKEASFHPPGVRWHFLGAIQTNKLARLVGAVDCFESVARTREVDQLARRRPGAAIMVQLELSGLPGRNGATQVEAPGLVAAARSAGLEVWGLMTVAPPEPDAARRAFRRLVEMADDLGLPERSMGMSEDLEIAVEEGSTLLRIGRGLFGARPAR
jgi:PLP dependent protein